jgi:hypothetical protein
MYMTNKSEKGAYKMTESIRTRLVEVITEGGTITAACAMAGISRQTFNRWLGEHSGFRETIDRARSLYVYRATQTVFSDIDNVKTAMWVLKRNEKKEEAWDELPDLLPYSDMQDEVLRRHLSHHETKSEEIRSEFARRHPLLITVTDTVGVTDAVDMSSVLCINVGDEVHVSDQAVLQETQPDPEWLKLQESFSR